MLLSEHTAPDYETVWTDTLEPYTGRRHFTAEYPWAEAGPAGLTERLDRALEPLLAAAEPPGEDCCSRWTRRLEPLVAATREKTAADPACDPPTALGHLAGGGHAGLAAAVVVVVRELAGRERTSLEDALATVLVRADAWHYRGRYPDARAVALDAALTRGPPGSAPGCGSRGGPGWWRCGRFVTPFAGRRSLRTRPPGPRPGKPR
ncbi:hypothetical protein [Streptomyces sp. NPDC048462]|uniref:hypothetical protein n=1 Tax=Streptomyces sp. NPDC048462 TaxID=3365555 RepID=UPI0037133E82